MWDCQDGYTSKGLLGVSVVEVLVQVQEGRVDCCRSEFGNLARLNSDMPSSISVVTVQSLSFSP